MSVTAELFIHGRSQAVRLPEAFRLPGTEVRVTRVGHKVVLEPVEVPTLDIDAWWRSLDALGASDFLTDDLPRDNRIGPGDALDLG